VVHDPALGARYGFRAEGDDLIVDTLLEPGGRLPSHRHPRHEERWSVIEGRVRARVGRATRVIGAKDPAVLVRPGTAHELVNVGDREARLRCVAHPAAGLQPYLEERAAAARAGLVTRRGRPRGMRGARWTAGFLARHREEAVQTRPPRIVQRALIAVLAREARGAPSR
jgi:mannose-6-phosphate isomerase-like protein (cupin superfamily)